MDWMQVTRRQNAVRLGREVLEQTEDCWPAFALAT